MIQVPETDKIQDFISIYIDNNIVRFSQNKLNKKGINAISFNISLESIKNFNLGKKIESIIKKLDKEKIDFIITPLPRCLFGSGYPEIVAKKMLNKPIKFFIDGEDFRTFDDYDNELFQNKLQIYDKCSGCKFISEKRCEGVFSVRRDKVYEAKLQQWLIEKIINSKNIKLLDLGCGISPFLDLYKQSSSQGNSYFLCVDPSEIYISVLKKRIPTEFKSNIVPVIGTAEDIKLEDNTFNFVLLHYSYAHIRDVRKAIKNIRRLLKEGGIVLIFDDAYYHGGGNKTVRTREMFRYFLEPDRIWGSSIE